MTWTKALMAIPTSALKVDPGISSASSHGYTEQQLQEIAATVPAIYNCIDQGWSEADFNEAARSSDARDRQLGETFERLFGDANGSSLLATFDGRDLVVQKGNHRVLAARSIDVPVLPVWVSAATHEDLDRVSEACGHRIQQEGGSAYLEAHHKLEKGRGHFWSIDGERAASPEGLERDRSGPEFLR